MWGREHEGGGVEGMKGENGAREESKIAVRANWEVCVDQLRSLVFKAKRSTESFLSKCVA